MIGVEDNEAELIECGLIMPIADTPGYPSGHWSEVKNMIDEGLQEAGFKGRLVSDADDVGVIHARIVKNLFEKDIIVCDISSRNPNVMFELGLRLAFDKPTIPIRDDETGRIFDTDIIEYISYPKSLRHGEVQAFQDKFGRKVRDTYDSFKSGTFGTVFLGHFQITKPAHLETVEAAPFEILSKKLDDLSLNMGRMIRAAIPAESMAAGSSSTNRTILCARDLPKDEARNFENHMFAFSTPPLRRVIAAPGHFHLEFSADMLTEEIREAILNHARTIAPNARWLPSHQRRPILNK